MARCEFGMAMQLSIETEHQYIWYHRNIMSFHICAFILQKLQVYKSGPFGGCIFMKSFPFSREIPYWKRYCWWWKHSGTRTGWDGKYPIILQDLCTSQVVELDFYHQQYVGGRLFSIHLQDHVVGWLDRWIALSVDSSLTRRWGAPLDRGWRCHIRGWWVHEGYFGSPFKQIEMFWTQLERWYGKHVDK